MREARSPAAVLAAFLLGVLLLVTGCAGVPTSGAVQDGGSIEDAGDDDSIALQPGGPQPGADQREILEGFLDAATNAEQNYATARGFLSESFANEWDPNQVTYVRDEVAGISRIDDTTLQYSFSASAYVDGDGRYQEGDSSFPQTLQVQFVQDGGQWRIRSVPNGIVLSEARFAALFGSYPLWFFDPSYRYLVPDLRWFANRRTNLASAVVTQLLQGPAEFLGGGSVTTAFPRGTLRGNSVEVDDQTAVVDLSAEASSAAPADLARMRQQLTQTLGDGFGVSRIQLTVDQLAQPLQPGTASEAIARPTVGPNPLVIRDGRLGFIGAGEALAAVPGLGDQVVAAEPRALTVGVTSDAALLTASGVVRVVPGAAEGVLVDARDGLLPPSIDPDGRIWTARPDSSAIRVTSPEGDAVDVPVPIASDSRLTAYEVSRDGARMLLAYTDSAGAHLLVTGIVRQDGVPASLVAEPLALPVVAGTPLDVTWVDELTVAVLSDGAQGAAVTAYTVGGLADPLGVVEGATAIAGGNIGLTGLGVLAEDRLLQRRGSSWQVVGTGVAVLATQS